MSAQFQPTVLWISGGPGSGKSTLSRTLSEGDTGIFSTDEFVASLPNWCDDPFVAVQAKEHGRRRIGKFLDKMVKSGKGPYIAQLLLHSENGFKPSGGISLIEGYMPLEIQQPVMEELECKGYYVWVVTRVKQFQRVRGAREWR